MPQSQKENILNRKQTKPNKPATKKTQMKINNPPTHVFLPVLQRFPTIHYIQAQYTNFNYISTCTPIPNKTSACANILVLLDFFGCLLLSIQLYQISASKQIYFMLSQ